MRILHILDHSLPSHSGYSFRTVAILREQRALGWETLQLTTPRHGGGRGAWRRSMAGASIARRCGERRGPASRGQSTCRKWRPPRAGSPSCRRRSVRDILHAHSPVLNALPALWVGRRLGIPVVYEVRALWEDAAIDHGTTTEGSARYRASRALETFALRHADHVTTICEGLRAEIATRGIAAGSHHGHPECSRHERSFVRRRARCGAATEARARGQDGDRLRRLVLRLRRA